MSYLIGIDLGTTNCAVSYLPLEAATASVERFAIPQLVERGVVEPRPKLPSFMFLPPPHDLAGGGLDLPWSRSPQRILGRLAVDWGAEQPERLVSSAKSWLCHAAVDRHEAILPWGAAEEIERVSPVEATAAYLTHLKEAWNQEMAAGAPEAAMEACPIVLTVPASFDEMARRLTVEAAQAAGLRQVTLLEEPQAALYSFLGQHLADFSEALAPGDRVLVVDVGGGTTDFTLIDAAADEAGQLTFERTAVGEHLLLGGDNMDLALVRRLEGRFKKQNQDRRLDVKQWLRLRHSCRRAKEELLSQPRGSTLLTVAGSGSRLIGGSLQEKLTRSECLQVVLEGFFPEVSFGEERSCGRARHGLSEWGLPFVREPAITRHLRDFLADQRDPRGEPLWPTKLLFNGGALQPEVLRQRIEDVVSGWLPEDRELEPLTHTDLDLAVAEGAALFGWFRHHGGVRIGGGIPRSYYVGIEEAGAPRALCLIPRGMNEGEAVEIDRRFELVANRPAIFPLYTSASRLGDAPGTLYHPERDDLHSLPALTTFIKLGKRKRGRGVTVPIHLTARLTAIGTLELGCHAIHDEREWRLEFQARGEPEALPADDELEAVGDEEEVAPAAIAEDRLEAAEQELEEAFGGDKDRQRLQRLARILEERLDRPRDAWPLEVCRRLAEKLLELRDARRRSPAFEERWLNLIGFTLRPGFGSALDEFRVGELWKKVFLQGICHRRHNPCRIQWWIALRRVAGGLVTGHQDQVFGWLSPQLLQDKHLPRHEAIEAWRLVANLERLSRKRKIRLGNRLLEILIGDPSASPWGLWALGRLGARTPFYGPLNEVVSSQVAGDWLRRLLDEVASEAIEVSPLVFACCQLGRLTGDRSREVDDALRQEAYQRLREVGASQHSLRSLQRVVRSEGSEAREFAGDSLPAGLRLLS